MFSILWKWAKRDNLEARAGLLLQMTMIHGPSLILPSSSFDSLTHRRYDIIMAIHSIGSDFDSKNNNYIDDFYTDINGLGRQSTFAKCLDAKRSQECVKFAVENRNIPSFEAFAQEIDAFINAGYTAYCPGAAYYESVPKMDAKQGDKK